MYKSKKSVFKEFNLKTIGLIAFSIMLFWFLRRIIKSVNTIAPDPYDNNNDYTVFSCGTARQDQPTLSLVRIRSLCETIKSQCSIIVPWENEDLVMDSLKACCTDKDFQNLSEFYPRAEGAVFVSNVLQDDVKTALNPDERAQVNSYYISKGMSARI
jgi:hypothetical protein